MALPAHICATKAFFFFALCNGILSMARTISSTVTYGIVLTGDTNPLTVTNAGAIEAGNSIGVDGSAGAPAGGWQVENDGTISSNTYGVRLRDVGTVTNTGVVRGNYGLAVEAGGTVSNTGSIDGGRNAGVVFDGAAGTLDNQGRIVGGYYGVADRLGGDISNSGTIAGSMNGVVFARGTGTLVNSGSIDGPSVGASLKRGGSVLNSGTVTSNSSAVYIINGAGSVMNTGLLSGGGDGADLDGGGTLDNSGTIIGVNLSGVHVQGASGTVTNSGTITGGTNAIDFTGSFDDRVVLQPGAVENGLVVGGSGTNTLELASPAGTVPAAGTLSSFASFQNFGTVAVDAGASWDLGAGNVIGAGITLTDAGTLTNDGQVGSTVTVASGAGVLTNSATGTIAIAGRYAVFSAANATPATFSNAGLVSVASSFAIAVRLASGGSIVNTGTVAADGNVAAGVYASGAAASVVNDGVIEASATQYAYGEALFSTENATASNSGTITASSDGAFAIGIETRGPGGVDNSGTISATGGQEAYGIGVAGGGEVTNSGVVTATGGAAGTGIYISGGTGTVVNAGTLSGSTDAIHFVGSFDDRVILQPGAVESGLVVGGSATNTLELASPAGTVPAAGTLSNFVSFQNFGTVAVDAGASWDFGTGNTIGAGIILTDAGTLTNDGQVGSTVTVVAGAGTFTNAADGTIGLGTGPGVLAVAPASVDNAGTIASAGYGIALGAGGSATNSGSVSVLGDGLAVAIGVKNLGATVSNTGTLVAQANTLAAGIALAAGGRVDNGGTVLAQAALSSGIYVYGAAGTVTNSGTVVGNAGVQVGAGGSVLNTGTVLGGGDGVLASLTRGTTAGTPSLSVDNQGLILAQGSASAAVDFVNSVGTLLNTGSISGASYGVLLDNGGTVTNGGTVAQTGTVQGLNGRLAAVAAQYAAATVTNTGAVVGRYDGIDLAGGGTVINTGTAALVQGGAGYGVHVQGAPGTVTNAGTIADTNVGVRFDAGGNLNNTGTITGSNSYGAKLTAGGTVTNAGQISGGGSDGVNVNGSAGAVGNDGTIVGQGNAVALEQGGSIRNGGQLTGNGFAGVHVQGAAGTVANAGTITGASYGVDLAAGGSVSNAGSIYGARVGVYAHTPYDGGGEPEVVDVRRLDAAASSAPAPFYLDNTMSITGGQVGVVIQGQAGTIVNAGTIAGSEAAIVFASGGSQYDPETRSFTVVNYDNRLVLDPGAVLGGAVYGGSRNATNTLELAAGTAGAGGTVTNFASDFLNFGTVQVDAGASWSLAGQGGAVPATIALAGTLTNAESSDLTLSGTIAGTGTLVEDSAASALTLTNGNTGFSGTVALDLGTVNVLALDAAGTGSIEFGAGPARLNVAQAALGASGTGTRFGNTLGDFNTDDAIDVDGIGTATASFDYGDDVLTLTGTSGAATTLQFSGDYAGDIFTASADGTGGTDVTLSGAARPVITGAHATSTMAEAPVTPFSGVTVDDANPNSADTLTIASSGAGGTLRDGAGHGGLVAHGNGNYTLTGSAAAVTGELDALVFTPNVGTTTFQLTDTTGYGTTATDRATSVTDTAAASTNPGVGSTNPGGGSMNPGVGSTNPGGSSTNPGVGSTNPGGSSTNPGGGSSNLGQPVSAGTVSFDDQVSYSRGVFTLTGRVSGVAGPSAVDITAEVDGTATDLGSATVNADGTFAFQDRIGAHTQGFITATPTDAGGTASGSAGYALTGGLSDDGNRAEQDRYSADGSSVTATDRFKANGSQTADLFAPGETFDSAFFDTFHNRGAPESTFVFNPGSGRDVVDLFRVDGADHDTLSFKGSDFGNDIAAVLNASRDTAAGLLIADPVASSPGGGPGTHDHVLLKGITKSQLTQNTGDIAFHV